jgi:lipopolysaccharide export system protein LptA
MRHRREFVCALALGVTLACVAAAEPARESQPSKGGVLFDAGSFGKSKEPITIIADRLEYDYKNNVVVYRGDVLATQGETKVRSDTLTVTLAPRDNGKADPAAAKGQAADPPATKGQAADPPGTKGQAADPPGAEGQRLQEVVAVGNVRIDNGTRWATGGRAVFEQGDRTLVLTETPVLHDGSNEVAGDRVIVYLDENRSIVEGGRKRVKAVLYPNQNGDIEPAGTAPAAAAHAGAPGGAPQ